MPRHPRLVTGVGLHYSGGDQHVQAEMNICCDDFYLLVEGGTGEQDVPVSAMEAAAEGLSRFHGPHLGLPGDGFSALQLPAVEKQQVDVWTDLPRLGFSSISWKVGTGILDHTYLQTTRKFTVTFINSSRTERTHS